ncbi:hypothetical protein CEN45_14755 [Fischerella thermalis CCMEE 5198]|uniref:hypothetical protein n=1 Tax=Fischerella thermalis TaxID=372787 RepID=UPI000C7FAAFE|nr:hypothetical protein [Fischerella thermalis]PMB21441.1 hypothetical protein CEN45_14755 [Fischerella thermalis CCMEE 5198]
MNIIHNEGMKISSACILTPLYPYTHFQGSFGKGERIFNLFNLFPDFYKKSNQWQMTILLN